VMYDYGFVPSGMVNLNAAKHYKMDASGSSETLMVKWLDDDEGKLHLCGRWADLGDSYAKNTWAAFDAVPMSGRCSGPVFTVRDFDMYCRAKNNEPSLTTAAETAMKALEAKSTQGVLFKRDKAGLPDCKGALRQTGTNLYLPYGIWTKDGQEKIDGAMYKSGCNFPETRSTRAETDDEKDFVLVCYSTDALKFGQSAYFVSMPMVQFSNMWFCKTRKLSIVHQGMRNTFMNFSVIGEIAISLLLLYVPFMNLLFGTRPLEFWHFMVPAMPFAVWIFIFDEVRKYFVRQGDTPAGRAITGAKSTALGAWVFDHSYY